MRLDQLRRVEWLLADGEEGRLRSEVVPAEDAALLVEAVLKLHHSPGRNPHSGAPAARLLRLVVLRPRLDAGTWWSAPSLDEHGPRARLVVWEEELVPFAGESPAEDPDPD